MFGLSFSHLLLTVFVIGAVWYFSKFVKRVQDRENEALNRRRTRQGVGQQRGSARPGPTPRRDDDDVELMVECRTCGSFVAATGARSCGREDCPYPG